ncbi:MAG: flavodoxin domain-containing protein [Haloarculaceae archaeon]
MASVLVLYGTSEGQTAKIASRVADVLTERGHAVTTVDLAESAPGAALTDFDAVVVGSSIHLGDHQPAVTSFVADHRDALASLPTAFFQVSLSSAADDPYSRTEAGGYVEDFVAETGWNPARIGEFGGAIRYSEYGFLKKLLMKRIARDVTGDVDTSRDYEYTDWEDVTDFAEEFAALVETRRGATQSDTAE